MITFVWQKRECATGKIIDVELSDIEKDLNKLGYTSDSNIWRSFEYPHWVRVTKDYCYRKHAIK